MELTTTKNAGKVLVISITMRMRRYDAGRIARWSTSRASLEATGCRHWVSACTVLLQRPPWLMNTWKKTQNTNKNPFLASNYGTNQSLVVYENFIPQKGPSTQLVDATSYVKMCKTTIGAEELSYILSYQTLSADKN
jgi:hypothetical protein